MASVDNRYLWTRACESEALMELRIGLPEGRTRFDSLIDMARAELASRAGQGGIAYLDGLVAQANKVWS